jgi:hypothetical protein
VYNSLKLSLIGASLALAVPLAAQAAPQHPPGEWWHHHPHYVHAMSDVSTAYRLLQHANGDRPQKIEEQHAELAIRYAYQTLADASAVDRKNIQDIPPADTNTYDHRGRLRHALDLLHDAHDQVNVEEDDRDARGLKDRALKEIDAAAHATEDAIRTADY